MEPATLSTELGIVVMLAVFAASLWISYIVGVNTYPQAGIDPFARPAPLVGFRDWVHRAHRAHLNLLEQLLPFAVLVPCPDRGPVGWVLTAHLLDGDCIFRAQGGTCRRDDLGGCVISAAPDPVHRRVGVLPVDGLRRIRGVNTAARRD
ncbi:MAPEG family protein [Roseobacter weihaiensis]|uniref:MAPEG family protein n=1 Tax=Roseobacter weihaiensis TaxID=2763262 RepID=UPI001D0A3C30|nr:MAPEG family protein [Roseobacter sp. H9]